MKKIKDTKSACIICGATPSEPMHLTGIKIIKGVEEPYSLCKACCLHSGKGAYNEATEFRKKLWEQVDKKIAERVKKRK